MKHQILGVSVLAGVFLTGACHKAVPVAVRAPEPVQVAAVPQPPVAPEFAARPPATSAPATQNSSSTGMSPQERGALNDRLAHLEDALFDYDKSAIRADAATALKEDVGVIRSILGNYPSEKLRIEGHCDERGSDEYNMALGDKRAHAVAEFFETMGIAPAQLTVVSYGREKPVCTDQTEQCYQKNRRAHIVALN